MIAAALIIIFVVVRYISGAGQQASSQSDIAALQSQAELVKSSFTAKGWWANTTSVTYSQPTLTVTPSGGSAMTFTVDQETYPNLYDATSLPDDDIVGLYDSCMGGNIIACEVFGVIASGTT